MQEPPLAFTLIALGVIAPILAAIIATTTTYYSDQKHRRDFKKMNGIDYEEFLSLYYHHRQKNH